MAGKLWVTLVAKAIRSIARTVVSAAKTPTNKTSAQYLRNDFLKLAAIMP